MAKFEKANSVGEWLDQRLNLTTFNKVMMTEYWIPKDINFLWAMGVLLATTFGILVISGLFLMMYYKPDVALAFDSVNYTIMQEVAFGWLFRHMHGVAASVVFLIIYIHINWYRDWETDRKSTRLNSSHITRSRMPSSA